MSQEDNNNSFQTGTGSLKFGGGSVEIINGEEFWYVAGLGIYNLSGKFIGETVEEVRETLNRQKAEETSD